MSWPTSSGHRHDAWWIPDIRSLCYMVHFTVQSMVMDITQWRWLWIVVLYVLTLIWDALLEWTILPCIHCNNIDLCVCSTRWVVRMLQNIVLHVNLFAVTRLKSVLDHSSQCMRVTAEDAECCTRYKSWSLVRCCLQEGITSLDGNLLWCNLLALPC